MRAVVEGLEVAPAAMRRNIDMTQSLAMSEVLMMAPGPFIGREYAHGVFCGAALLKWALERRQPTALKLTPD